MAKGKGDLPLFSQKLNEWLEVNNCTQLELAERSKSSVGAINSYVTGKQVPDRTSIIVRLAHAMGYDPLVVMGWIIDQDDGGPVPIVGSDPAPTHEFMQLKGEVQELKDKIETMFSLLMTKRAD